MALINTSVPNLIQGVSQQPDATRFDGQCEEQVNALSSVAEGLKKRPNTRHIAKLLDTAIEDDSLVQFVNRSETERYVVIHTGTKMYAYNIISGAAAGIWYNAVEYTSGWTIPTDHYLYTTASPEKTINALSVGDSTFFVNKNVTVEKSTEKTEALVEEAIVTVIQGDYEKRYQVALGDGSEQGAVFLVNTVPVDLKGTGTQQEFYVITTGDSYALNVGGPSGLKVSSVDISQAGSGYTSNLTNNSNYLSLRFTSSSTGATTSIPLTISTNSAGEVTAVSVSVYTTTWVLLDVIGSSSIYGGTSSNSVTTLTVTSGPADGTRGGQNASTERIAQGFAGSTGGTNNGISGSFPAAFDRSRRGSVIKFKRDDGASFTISTSDGLADEGLSLAYTEVASITDLPLRNFNNFQIKIIGDTELAQDDYYVKFETADGSGFGTGSYNEVAGFDISSGIDKSTFPHRLINDELNSFVVKEAPLGLRQAGDDKANPMPSFVGQKINRLFVHRNRLGILSGDAIIFSEAGELFNFFRTTVSTLLDSAPIDVRVSSKNVVNISSAVGFQENLILFSEAGQFALKSGDLLTSKTVSINPVTNFEMVDGFEPIALGSYIYFPYGKGSFTGIREYTVNATTDTFDSSDIAEHVPAYIPSNVKKMVGSSSENIVVLLSGDETGSLYIYNYFWSNQQKVLSAWSKFTFTGEIRGIEFIDSTLYAVITNNGQTNLVEMPMESGLSDAAGYVTHLDMRVANTVTNGSSTITLPYTPADNTVQVYTTDGLALNCTNSGATVTLSSPVSTDTAVWVGIPYTMKYTFSEQLFKAKAGNGKSPSNAAKLMIRNGSLYFAKSAYFKVCVTPKFRDTYVNTFTPDVVGSSVLGSLSLDSGFYRFPVFTKAQDTTITIENESALPSTFQNAEFESFVHTRSNRYG
jgi:hypothetical protein